MTAVIYARYSSDNQREESIEGQIRECTAYAEKNGITIVKHYIDRAISAKTDNRPEFQQMIKDSDKKLFDIVLVWKLDRFARNRYDSARYKTQLKKNGVKLMSATEIISEGPEGIILESVLEGYAEYYSADLSEKVIRGMTENALKGKFTGGAIPFGYIINADHRFEIDPLTAPFVAETFQRYNDGQTMREIRDWLNEKGVKNQRGGLMTFNTIQHMLNNRRYIGELKYRDVLIPDAIPSIVSAELFNDVQEKIAKNKKAPARRKAEDDYLLTTKLFCGYDMYPQFWTPRIGGIFMKYSYEYKKNCVELYRQGKWPETPDGIKQENFRISVRRWSRREKSCGTESLQKNQKKMWSADEKYELIAKVLAGVSITESAISAGVEPSLLSQWVRCYKMKGYQGLAAQRKGRPPKEPDMKKKIVPAELTPSEREELIRLRAENEYLRTENEVIKKRIMLRSLL